VVSSKTGITVLKTQSNQRKDGNIMTKKKKTIQELTEMNLRGERFSTAVCYDYPWARLVDSTPIETILCGDSMGMAIYGYDSTVPVTMEQMIYHCKAVRAGAPNTWVMGDMVFGSYHESISDAVRNAVRLIKETGVDAIKLEGGAAYCEKIKAITEAGIVVVGHLGVTPQSAVMKGGFKAEGRNVTSARKLIEDSIAIYEAGCKAILLECVPPMVSDFINELLPIPILGGAAAPGTLVCDTFKMFQGGFTPRFAFKSKYNFSEMIIEELTRFSNEVKAGEFPREENLYTIKEDAEAFEKLFEEYKGYNS
jgi:3-methyl-2-oxobutanoate hydroxymethyltransferase